MANLRLQGSTYHARLTIPKDVRSNFGNKAEFSQSLETGNLKLAQVRGAEVVAGWKRTIQLAREAGSGVVVSEWVKEWSKVLRQADATSVKQQPSDRDNAEYVMQDILENLVTNGQFPEDAVREAIAVVTGEKVILSDHKEDFLKQYNTHATRTQASYKKALEHFLERFKEEKQITPKSIKLWLNSLSDEKKLAAQTIGRFLGTARAFWAYLAEHEITIRSSNPFETFKLTVPKTAAKSVPIVPFRPEQLVAILQNPKTLSDTRLTFMINISMYTGTRIEEVAMLRKSDVDMAEGTITIRESKTEAGEQRIIPIHPTLMNLFLALPEKDNLDDGYVVQGLTIDKGGERGKAAGKRFGRIKTKMGYVGRSYCFHSIRKTVATQLEQAGVIEGIAADILGHEKQTMTYGLYSGGTSIEQRREAINKIKYSAHSK